MEKRHKILVVDDDPKALRLMETLLKPYEYDLVLLSDGRQVIQSIRDDKPDLILLDIMMPVLDGYTLLHKIKDDSSISNIPIIMVTAVGYGDNRKLASLFGASAYITKPINSKHIIETIAQFLPDSTS